jgi:hypothetical protein
MKKFSHDDYQNGVVSIGIPNPVNPSDMASKQYVDTRPGIPGSQGPPGAPGAAGATGPAGPGIATGGIAGQLLVKNSVTNYDTAWAAPAPYYPPQTPPPTGFNSFTDASQMVWVSIAGSAWRRAANVLHARVYRAAALSTPLTSTKLAFDTVDEDVYGMFSMANNQFVAPIPGWYAARSLFTAVTGPNGWVVSALWKNGVLHSQGGGTQTAQAVTSYAAAAATIHCTAAGDNVAIYFNSNAAVALTTGAASSYVSMDYFGSG